MRMKQICSSALMASLVFAFPSSAQDISEAASMGDLVQLKVLVEEDPLTVNFKDEQGRTPLHWASRGVHIDVLEYLVENGADVNATDSDKVTPLHDLSYRGDVKAMEILIENGADVEAQDSSGMVPLMYASYAGHEEAAAALVREGANVMARDDAGGTAVDIAADQGNEKLTRFLLSNGAELSPVADPEIVKLADTIHKITFCYQQCTNMLVVESADGVLIIDTGYRRTADKLRERVHDIGKGKKTTIINTHQHYDHIGGNGIAGSDSNVISGENLDEMVFRGILKRDTSKLQGVSGRKYDAGYTLSFHEPKVRLIPLPGAHTDSDMVVHFEDAGIVHMGDLLISQSFPSLTRGEKIREYMAILDQVIDVFDDRTFFVGGHGRDLQKRELVAYRDMLQKTIDMVVGELAEGKSAEAMQREGVLSDYVSYDTFIPMLNTDYWIETVNRNYAIDDSQ
jgi:cyclase